ncbi:polysaccharide biosynthesis/export family protein [Cytophaga aurantiaca]|uniref:polysaccharide biosynthesis/export family protein n=1 Tax=Cytophaga aurantiaca TaxID=29530 RepID=UPI0003735C92|nr:polysaccharide biosynthesis/export family protein [Cytophaga aurantiaca]
MGKLHLFLILTLFLLAASCISIKKQTYFHGDITTSSTDSFSNPIKYYQLRPGDILYIKIISVDPRLSAFFNTDMGTSGGNVQVTPGNLYIQGYLVNDSGYVELPILGDIEAKGKTLNEVRADVTQQVNAMVSPSTVIVKFASFKVAVLGEVTRPGDAYFSNERVSILEALASVGDLTLTGKRSQIEVIRQHLDGSFERGILNLNDVNVVHSPYYFLQPNDIVYVPPTRTLASKFNLTNLSIAFAGISALVLILTYLNK